MSKYKISLLTPASEGSADIFIAITIADYTDQIIRQDLTAHKNNEQSFCYTYDEKFSQHQNSQKELSFSMDRKLLMHDEWKINPYINVLHVGSLIELVDKYNTTHLFIIKTISYNFKEHNIVYTYTCQDAFSYQYTRQQNGYAIENDPASSDYIGPKTIDWWTIKRIVPDCFIDYQYIPLQRGLYKNNITNQIEYFTSEKDLDESPKTIIKYPNNTEEYQTPFAFSCSNSNANAALIALSEQLDLMIHVYEERYNGELRKYFWYEPKQNQEVAGIEYSPKNAVSDFGLNFSGDSLTTVLNVDSHEIGDDLITLLPSTPAFFTNLFMSDEWVNSKFYPGYFNDIISNISYRYIINQSDSNIGIKINDDTNLLTIDNQTYIVIQIYNEIADSLFTLPKFYDHFKANWDNQNYTNFTYTAGINSYTIAAKNNTLYLIIRNKNNITNQYDYYIVKENEIIPAALLNRTSEIFIGILSKDQSSVTINNCELYIQFYRNFTEEEKNFADIADKCPWLENRLIDFTYFLKQHIISKDEYNSLMDTIQNKLRIQNGKLIFLTDEYHRALKTKTTIISQITEQVDNLAATFDADIVQPLLEGKKPDDISRVYNLYQQVINIDQNSNRILNYTELLSDYFEKYFNSEQCFLKNIYAFRKYFEDPFNQDINASIHSYTITATPVDNNFILFGNPSFQTIYDDQGNLKDNITKQVIFKKEKGLLQKLPIINTSNYQEFYVANLIDNQLINLSTSQNLPATYYDYNSNNTYWLKEQDYNQKNFKTRNNLIKKIINQETYIQLNADEIRRLILRKTENLTKYYIKDKNTYTAFDDIRIEADELSEVLAWSTLPNLLKYWNINADFKMKSLDITKWSDPFFYEYYKAFFPITTLYYYGPVIQATTRINESDQIVYTLKSLNENGKVDNTTTYKTYQPIAFAGNGMALKEWGPCSNDEAVAAQDKINNSWNYAAFNFSPSVGDIIFTVGLGNTWGIISAVNHALYDERWCKWKTNKNNYRSFEGEGDVRHSKTLAKNWAYAQYATTTAAADESVQWMQAWYQVQDKQFNKTLAITNDNLSPITWQQITDTIIHINIDDLSTQLTYDNRGYEYFNFYRYMVATYDFRRDMINKGFKNYFAVKNKYFRILNKNSYINKYDTYVRIPIYESSNGILNTTNGLYLDPEPNVKIDEKKTIVYIKDPSNFTNTQNRYSLLTWYPIEAISTDIAVKNLDVWKGGKDHITLGELIESLSKPADTQVDFIDNNDYIIQISNGDNVGQYLYARLENYNIINEDLFTQDDLSTIYDMQTDLLTNVLQLPQTLYGIENLYMVINKDDLMVPVDNSYIVNEQLNAAAHYYYKLNNSYVRTYSLEQLTELPAKDHSSLCYLANSIYSIETLRSQNNFILPIYLCSFTTDSNSNIILNCNLYSKSFEITKSQEYSITKDDITYTSDIKIIDEIGDSLSNLTNGMFWYKYHNQIESSTLFEYAAAIETQLQVYWDQAYAASKNCKYFLPRYWQGQEGKTTNNISKEILIPTINNNNVITNITISNKYVPEVAIYENNDNNVDLKYKHYLTNFIWKYQPSTDRTLDSLTPDAALLEEQHTTNYIAAESVTVLKDNPGVLDIIKHLNTTLSDWYVVENGNTVYYYNCGENTGLEWKDVANEVMDVSVFEQLDGIYGMIFFILKNGYSDCGMLEYEQTKKTKIQIWNNIYAQYPFLMLEDNYSYELATSSAELLKMAELIFKDRKEPEKAYTISMIDIHALSGYIGQQLTPGQGIRIKADDYYDENDDVYNALTQYLFITDVSYSLRNDADINLTVNSIKYQEKLLQSLVKLIR